MEKQFMESIENLGQKIYKMDWENPEVYGFWLRQTLGFVSHTTRLICLAAARTPLNEPKGHAEWVHHLREETNHDLLLQRDLKTLGNTPDYPVYWSIEQMIQNQYYHLEHEHPLTLRGYSLFLEGLACQLGPKMITRLEKTYHRNQLNFIRVHAQEDQDHFAEGVQYLSTIPNLPVADIQRNLVQSEQLYGLMLDEAIRLGGALKETKSA